MKLNKKWILIAIIAVVVAAAAILAAFLLTPKTPDYTFPPFVDTYEKNKNYTSQDPNIVFDGVLNDAAWSDQRWLEVKHITEESIGVKMTSYFGTDGLYMAFDVNDLGVFFDEKKDAAYNSGIQLYVSSLDGAKNITGCGYEISLTAGGQVKVKKYTGQMYELYLGRVYTEAVVKGELNSEDAKGYTLEAYIDYDLFGENCKQVYANAAIVRSMSETGSDRQWYSFGQNDRGAAWTRAETWWTFGEEGLVAYDVTMETGDQGAVDGKPYVPGGDDYTFCIVPNQGYYAKQVMLGTEDVTSALYYIDGKTCCTVENVQSDLDIQVAFEKVPEITMTVSGKVSGADGIIPGAKLWAVLGGYEQALSVDAEGNYSGEVPAIAGLQLFASAQEYVSQAVTAQEGENNIVLQKMYFGKNETTDRNSTNQTMWDLNRLYLNRVRLKSTDYAMELVNYKIYSQSIFASAKLKTDVKQGVDTRAGFTFYVNKEMSIFVALTMNGEVNEFNPEGKVNCTIQLITEINGERFWGPGGIIVPIENQEKIMEMAAGEGVPVSVHYSKGAIDVWVDGQQVGYGIYSKDENGYNRFSEDTAVAVGLQCWGSRAVYEDLHFDGNYPPRMYPSAPNWDLSRLGSGIAVSQSDKSWSSAMLSTNYYNKLCMTANVPLIARSGVDLRAGFLLKNSQGKEIFVALTANGEKSTNNPNGDLYYTVQVISGGMASWKVDGKITDVRGWDELKTLAKNGGVPMTVYIENGKLTIGVNGYLIAENVIPLDKDGSRILAGNALVAPGLATARTALTFTNVSWSTSKPSLKDPSLRDWDVSKADEGIYTRTSQTGWASLFLTKEYAPSTGVSAKLPHIAQEGKDLRAGFVFRNEKGVEVFVSLTANGEKNTNNPNGDLYYTVQVISGGYASWKVDGKITDVRSWNELHQLAETDGIPVTAYMENGKLTIGVGGYLIAEDVIPLAPEGGNILGENTDVRVGLATTALSLTYNQVTLLDAKPSLKDPNLRGWDLSKLSEGEAARIEKAARADVVLWDTLREKYYITSEIDFSAAAEDVRAGYCFYDSDGNKLFVSLLRAADGAYAVQMIATPKTGGFHWLWNYRLNGLSSWPEGGMPFGVAYDSGKFDVWVGGNKIGADIAPAVSGTALFTQDDLVCVGLECWSTTAQFQSLAAYDINDEPEQTVTSTEVEITQGYSESDKYVVLSARLRSLTELKHDWSRNAILSVSGEANWQNYAFQIVYGKSSEQNLIKLNDNKGYDGTNVLQEQWYNNAKLEKLFADGGIEIKVIRMDTKVYLLADMGDGYERIGVMTLPADAPTQFKLYAPNMDVRLNRVTVEVGEEAAKEALASGNPDVLVNSKGAAPTVIPGDYTSANYAVLEANIKALDAITYDWNSNIIVSVSGSARWADKYDMQILYGKSATQNLVKLAAATSTVDGIKVPMEQWINSAAFEKPFSDEGMNIKVIRLNTWVYLLADMGSGYTVVGKMTIPESAATEFSVYNSKTAVQISNFSVKTGKDAALEALDGITLDVDIMESAFAVPIDTTQWTMEGKVSFQSFSATDDYRLFVSSSKSEWRRISIAYILAEKIWKGQSVAQVDGKWSNANIPNGALLTGDGLWARWVRDGANLSLYVSTDRENWTYVFACNNCGTTNSVIYVFESVEKNAYISDLRIRTGIPQDGTEEEPGTGTEPEEQERKVESISLKDLPYQVSYRVGDTFQIVDASYEVRYADGDVAFYAITREMCSEVDMTQSGTQTVYVNVSHDGFEAQLSFDIEIIGDPEAYEPTIP